MTKRQYEGTVQLQDIGELKGIKAKNLRVGDFRIYNYGSASEVVKTEASASGKTVKVTTKWYNKHAKLENGAWAGEWQEVTRTVKADTIVAVRELNPAEAVVEVEEVQQESASTETKLVENSPKQQVKKSAFQKWFEAFLDEKCVDMSQSFTIDHRDYSHIIEMEFLRDVIIKASKQEQKQIKDKLVYIDFKNGDVGHFFSFLAGAYIQTNY